MIKITKKDIIEVLPPDKRVKEEIDSMDTYSELSDFFHEGWFSNKWVVVLYNHFCSKTIDFIDLSRVPKSFDEKIDIFFQSVMITDLTNDIGIIYDVKARQEQNIPHEAVMPKKLKITNKVVKTSLPLEEPQEQEVEPEEIDSMNPLPFTLENIKQYFENLLTSSNILSTDWIDRGIIGTYGGEILQNQGVSYQSEFLITVEEEVYTDFMILLDEKKEEVVAFGSLVADETEPTRYHIIMEVGQIDFSAFENSSTFYVGLFEKSFDIADFSTVSQIHLAETPVEMTEMQETDRTLCIDFGTSNSCAGSYGLLDEDDDAVEIVLFPNGKQQSELYPTIVYVQDCSDKENIQYLFGYEALETVRKKNFDTKASVFFEIKRFVGSMDKTEKIYDELGKFVTVTRGDLISAYIHHMIYLSEQYFQCKFKNLHFSAPVKLKRMFFNQFSKILDSNYQIKDPSESLDEGIAIIYYNIKKLIDVPDGLKSEKKKIMILDCGGGTTDLATCEVDYDRKSASTLLKLNSTFVNGNSDFGGNNVTYKILQLIKMKMVENLKGNGDIDLFSLITDDEDSILDKSFEIGSRENVNSIGDFEGFNEEIYQNFQEYYDECEKILPTIFGKQKKDTTTLQDIACKKRNYYYLWQLAEKIKIQFYEKDIVSFEISEENTQQFHLGTLKQEFFVYEEGKLVPKTLGSVNITIKELHRLLCGDIYCLLNAVLLAEEPKLLTYDYYKLAGQSCKISLFIDLLKEFIPGRLLRSTKKSGKEVDNSSLRLKRACIEGSVQYMKDMESSRITPELHTSPPALIYDIVIEKSNEILLGWQNPSEIQTESFGCDTKKATFLIRNKVGANKREIHLNLDQGQNRENVLELTQIMDKISKESFFSGRSYEALEDHLRTISPKEEGHDSRVLIGFPILSQEGYGINIYFVEKTEDGDKTKYCLVNSFYENFEDEAKKSFFDGRK